MSKGLMIVVCLLIVYLFVMLKKKKKFFKQFNTVKWEIVYYILSWVQGGGCRDFLGCCVVCSPIIYPMSYGGGWLRWGRPIPTLNLILT